MPGAAFEPRCPPAEVHYPVAVDPLGRAGPTKRQAAGPRWRRVAPRRYLPAHVDSSVPEQRVVEATASGPADLAATGWAALRLAGAAYFDGLRSDGRTRLPVPVAAGSRPGIRAHRGVEISYESLDVSEVTTRSGIRVTVAVRSLFYEMRRPGDWREAVVAMDMAAAAELVSIRRMAGYHAEHTHLRRASQVAKALPYCSERSRSPAEVRMRLLWEVDAGLPRPLVNREVFDLRGRLVCIADLFDEAAGLVVEYDGAEHRTRRRHTRDVVREEKCRRVGLEYCKVTGGDAPEVVLERFASTRARAAFRRPADRDWTLDYPPSWMADTPLDEKLDRWEWVAAQFAARGVHLPDGG